MSAELRREPLPVLVDAHAEGGRVILTLRDVPGRAEPLHIALSPEAALDIGIGLTNAAVLADNEPPAPVEDERPNVAGGWA